jgi:hypothetical protein
MSKRKFRRSIKDLRRRVEDLEDAAALSADIEKMRAGWVPTTTPLEPWFFYGSTIPNPN